MHETIRSLSAAYGERSTTPSDFLLEVFERIDGSGASLNCFITVLRESARRQAEASTSRFEKGVPLGPLDGVPIAIKDLFYLEGVRCTAGSKILASNIASYDSPVSAKLKASGAVLVGTTNMHEFAAGITGENPHYGAVRNPWDLLRIPGGSSSGSAAAVAARLVVAALGTDTAGSVRVPAALCGIVGFKPTYGRISRLGVVPLSSSFDTVGTLTSCSWDAAALLNLLAGHQEEDLTTVPAPVPDYTKEIGASAKGMRIGVPRKHFHENIDPGVETVFSRFLDRLTEVGCTLQPMEIEGIEKVDACWRTIRMAEATAFHLQWLDRTPEAYGDDVRALLVEGKKVLATEYVNAQNLRPILMQDFARSMSSVDAVAVPSTAVPATQLGQREVEVNGRQTTVRSALIGMTLPFNVVGFPAISLPGGLSHGLPVGVQLAAGPFEEPRLLRIASAYEGTSPYPIPPSITV